MAVHYERDVLPDGQTGEEPGGVTGGKWRPSHATMKALACATWATAGVLTIEGFTGQQLDDIGQSVKKIDKSVEHAFVSGVLDNQDADTAVLLAKCNVDAVNEAAIPSMKQVLALLNPSTETGRVALESLGDERFCDFVALIVHAAETMPGKSRKILMDTVNAAFKDDLVREAMRRIAGQGIGLGERKRSIDLQARLIYNLGSLGVQGEEAATLCARILLHANKIINDHPVFSHRGRLPISMRTAARLVRATGDILRSDQSPGHMLPSLMGRLCGGMIVNSVFARNSLAPDDVANMLEGLTKLGHKSRPFTKRLRLLYLRDHIDGARGMEKHVLLRSLSRIAYATSVAGIRWPRLYMTVISVMAALNSEETPEVFRSDFFGSWEDLTEGASSQQLDPSTDADDPTKGGSNFIQLPGLTIAERIRLDWALGVTGWSGLKNEVLLPVIAQDADELDHMNPSVLAMLISAVAEGAASAAADFVEAATIIRTSSVPSSTARALKVAQASRESYHFRMLAFQRLLEVLGPALISFSPAEIAEIASSFAIVVASASEARPLDMHLCEDPDGHTQYSRERIAAAARLWKVPLPEGLLKRFCLEAERWAATFTEEELSSLTWCIFEALFRRHVLTDRYQIDQNTCRLSPALVEAYASSGKAERDGDRLSGQSSEAHVKGILSTIKSELSIREEAQRGGRYGAFHLGSLKAFLAAISTLIDV
uniref:Uncharacterized protein n=1 Tax=Pinguiococcus pyrenoidosus TaxID=172671 RepID=A0A7R9YDN8_9STRA